MAFDPFDNDDERFGKPNNPFENIDVSNKENDLVFTPEKFRKDLNAQLQKVNVSYLSPVMEFKRENGEVNNTINYMFTEAVGLVGTVNKTNNNIKEITLIYGGDSEKDVADYLIVAGSIANAISPNSTELPKRILDLMNQALEKKNEKIGKKYKFKPSARPWFQGENGPSGCPGMKTKLKKI